MAKVSEDALTAVSLAFPIQTLMIAVCAGTGVGVNALLSKLLGEKSYERANKTAVNGVFLAFLSFLLLLMFSIIVDWSALAELSTYASFSIASAFDFEFVTFNTAISFPKTIGLEI